MCVLFFFVASDETVADIKASFEASFVKEKELLTGCICLDSFRHAKSIEHLNNIARICKGEERRSIRTKTVTYTGIVTRTTATSEETEYVTLEEARKRLAEIKNRRDLGGCVTRIDDLRGRSGSSDEASNLPRPRTGERKGTIDVASGSKVFEKMHTQRFKLHWQTRQSRTEGISPWIQ